MRRRHLLRAVPGLGTMFIAGCSMFDVDSSDSPTEEEPTSDSPPTTTGTETPTSVAPVFEVADLSVPESISINGSLPVSVTVQNVGTVAGETVVEFELGTDICRKQVALDPEEHQEVTCEFGSSAALSADDLTVTLTNGQSSLRRSVDLDPKTLNLPWSGLRGPAGGPVTDISVSRSDPSYVYATTETAGLYASTNGGQSWVQGAEAFHHRRGIEASPHDPAVAWNKQNITTTAGDTWQNVRQDLPRDYGFRYTDIEFDPHRQDVRYVGTPDGIYKTADGGSSWHLLEFPTSTTQIRDIDTAADASGVVFAVTNDATVFRSTDHGESWEQFAANDIPSTIRGLVSTNAGDVAYVCQDATGLIEVRDGDMQVVGPAIEDPYFLFYDGPTISADDARVYFHAVPHDDALAGDMWSGMDLFAYDTATGETTTVDIPERPACVTAHPTEPTTVFFGGWSWVWKRTELGGSWEALSEGFNDRYLAAVGTNPDASGTVLAGSICSTGVSVSHDGGQQFQWQRSGLGPFHEGAFNEHYVMQIAAAGQRAYVTTAAGLLISDDNGRTWRLLDTDFSGSGNQASGGSDLAKHLHGVAVDPTDPDVVYVGTGLGGAGTPEDHFDGRTGLWKSRDGGQTWTSITEGFPTDRDTTVQDILVSRDDPAVVYVATKNTDYIHGGRGDGKGTGLGVYRSADGGRQWEKVSVPVPNAHALAQDGGDPQRLYMSTREGIYQTQDDGDSWVRVLEAPTKGLLSYPKQPGVVFAGSQYHSEFWDLLVSRDGGETWSEGNLTMYFGDGETERTYDGRDEAADYRQPRGDIMDIAVDSTANDVYAATRGGGLWKASLDVLLEDG